MAKLLDEERPRINLVTLIQANQTACNNKAGEMGWMQNMVRAASIKPIMQTVISQRQGANMIPIRCHAVAGVALSEIDGQTKVLLMNRVKGGFWCHVAGSVEAGETGWQTIIREFGEETSIAVSDLYNGQYLEQFYEVASNTISVVPVFVVYCPPNQPVMLNDEHTEYRWCTLAEAKALVSFPGQKALYDHVWHYFVVNSPSAQMKITIDP